MSKVPLVFWSWFNGRRWKGHADPQWLQKRAELWKYTALESIQRQTVHDWTYVLFCAQGTEEMVRPLLGHPEARVRVVFGDVQAKNALPEADSHLAMRVDSDDRLHPRVGQLLLENSGKGRPWLQFNDGFAAAGRKIYHWNSHSSPFYARVFHGLKEDGIWIKPDHTTLVGKAKILPAGNFCVTLHDHNSSTRRYHAGAQCNLPTAVRVCETFGIR